ncbi:MAG: carbohydrate ABC transporter permease [Planctomycetota bacterium]|nr:carbohydrate ABC transporter permease [Planctomycetota bacterium]
MNAMKAQIPMLLWIYCALSILLLLAVRRTRHYPLYILKSVWIGFTVLAFVWVVLMSGATNQEFALRPASVFGELSEYPYTFRSLYGFHSWYLPLLLWLPLWSWAGKAERGSRLRKGLWVALGALTLFFLVPLLLIFKRFDWSAYSHFGENYAHAWRVARMGDYFFNSILVSACAVGLSTIVGSMAAYALARLPFRGREALIAALVGSMAIPGFLLVVPLYVMMRSWSVGNFSFMDSRVGLSILYAATSLPFTIFLLTAFFRSLPSELAEAAALDGATPLQIFSQIYFPLAAPGLATAAIFNFLGVWNEYNFALVFVTNPEFRTLPVGLYNLQVSQQYAVNWPALFAGIVLLCLPTFAIFVALQEKIVAGLTVGGVKG